MAEMPREEKEDRIDPETMAKIRAVIEADRQRKLELARKPYDGILGLPPDWVPEPIIRRFVRTQQQLLLGDEWSPERIVHFLDTYGKDEMSEWFGIRRSPRGKLLDGFHDNIGFLANLRWAVSLGSEKGLLELAGELAGYGYKMKQGSQKPREDALSAVMKEALGKLYAAESKLPTWRDLLSELEPDLSGQGVVQEIDWAEEKIWWRTPDGREKTTTFKSFRGRYTSIRKPKN